MHDKKVSCVAYNDKDNLNKCWIKLNEFYDTFNITTTFFNTNPLLQATMASSKLCDVMTKLTENHLTCRICLSTFTDPRILDCTHSYCLTCLQNLETQPLEDVDLSSQLKCPICREITSLNEMGADGLKRNFTLKSLQDDIIHHQNLLSGEPKAACSQYDARSETHYMDCNIGASGKEYNLNQDSVEKLHSQPKNQCQRHPHEDYCLLR